MGQKILIWSLLAVWTIKMMILWWKARTQIFLFCTLLIKTRNIYDYIQAKEFSQMLPLLILFSLLSPILSSFYLFVYILSILPGFFSISHLSTKKFKIQGWLAFRTLGFTSKRFAFAFSKEFQIFNRVDVCIKNKLLALHNFIIQWKNLKLNLSQFDLCCILEYLTNI